MLHRCTRVLISGLLIVCNFGLDLNSERSLPNKKNRACIRKYPPLAIKMRVNDGRYTASIQRRKWPLLSDAQSSSRRRRRLSRRQGAPQRKAMVHGLLKVRYPRFCRRMHLTHIKRYDHETLRKGGLSKKNKALGRPLAWAGEAQS